MMLQLAKVDYLDIFCRFFSKNKGDEVKNCYI